MAKQQFDNKGNERIRCEMCGGWFHQLPVHLNGKHSTTVEQYHVSFPGAPTVSDYARSQMAAAKLGNSTSTPVNPVVTTGSSAPAKADSLYFGAATLPILKDLTAKDMEQVPEHDDDYKFWNKEGMEAAGTAIELDLNLLIVGPTGCGKTSMVVEMAALLNQPVKKINMDGDIRSSDFLGQMTVIVDKTSGQSVTAWEDGILPTAMRNGWWLIIDELDAAPPQILFALQSVLEGAHKLTLKENGGEVVTAHRNFRIIATANTLGRGDTSGHYTGTNVLNEATLDRFGVVTEFGYPGVSQEASIVNAKTEVTSSVAKDMCTVAKMVRNGADNDECFCTFSTRRIINWAILASKLEDHGRAAKYTILQRLAPEDRDYVTGVIQRVMGGDIR